MTYHIVTDTRRTYHRVIARLAQETGAEIIELDTRRARQPVQSGDARRQTLVPGLASTVRIVGQLLSPRLVGLRRRWGSDDVVIVLGWYLLPIVILMRLGVLRRPRRLISLYLYARSARVRQAITAILRVTAISELELIMLTSGQQRSFAEAGGVPSARVHAAVWTSGLSPETPTVDGEEEDYVFTGGYTNRDYETFFAAVGELPYPVEVVASAEVRLPSAPSHVIVRTDIPWADFEERLARCRLLVVPLLTDEVASGASVLQRGMRYLRPVIATRHEALFDHLGADYPGFVEPGDAGAMRSAIKRAMDDDAYRTALVDSVTAHREQLAALGDPASQILAILRAS